MLLRRVIEHVKIQNWTAIGIDFFIVVIGVFVGLQVSNWNTERSLHAQEIVYLQRLLADTEYMLEASRERGSDLQERIADIVTSLDALQSCALSDSDRIAFDSALILHQTMPRLDVIHSTYDEMVAGGALAGIDNLNLKDQVSAIFSSAETIQEVIGYFSADLGRASDIIWRKVSFSISLDDVAQIASMDTSEFESLTQTVSYDFDALCTDTVFRNAMIEVLDSQLDRYGSGTDFARQLVQLRDLIAAHY